MLEVLPPEATLYVRNENELHTAVGVTNNLRSLAASVKFIGDNVPQNGNGVNTQYSLSKPGEASTAYGNYRVSGEDVRLDVPVADDIAPLVEKANTLSPDDIAPPVAGTDSEDRSIEALIQRKEALEAQMQKANEAGNTAEEDRLHLQWQEVAQELYYADRIEELEMQIAEGQYADVVSDQSELDQLISEALTAMPAPSIKFITLNIDFNYEGENLPDADFLHGTSMITLSKGMGIDSAYEGTALLLTSTGTMRHASCYDESLEGQWIVDWAESPRVWTDFETGCLYRMDEYSGWSSYQIEKEWINPPMVIGTEYRTTERWMSKPVYSKVISLGSLPNATVKYVSHGLPVTHDKVIGLRVVATNSTETIELPAGSGGSFAAYAFCKDDTVAIRSSVDLSGYTATAELKWVAE